MSKRDAMVYHDSALVILRGVGSLQKQRLPGKQLEYSELIMIRQLNESIAHTDIMGLVDVSNLTRQGKILDVLLFFWPLSRKANRGLRFTMTENYLRQANKIAK